MQKKSADNRLGSFSESPSLKASLTDSYSETPSSKLNDQISQASKSQLSSQLSATVKNVMVRTSFPTSDILDTGQGTQLARLDAGYCELSNQSIQLAST